MTERSSVSQPKGSARARRSKAVAEEAPVQAPEDSGTAAPAEAAAPEVRRCCERRTIFVTDGRAAEAVAYCRLHLPGNITRDMVKRYQALT